MSAIIDELQPKLLFSPLWLVILPPDLEYLSKHWFLGFEHCAQIYCQIIAEKSCTIISNQATK